MYIYIYIYIYIWLYYVGFSASGREYRNIYYMDSIFP